MRRASERFCCALVLGCALLHAQAATAAGGVFKWVDGKGITRYDDQSRLAERLTRLSIAKAAVAPDARATVPSAFVTEVAEQCADLKERRSIYLQAREVYGRDPGGNQYRFSRNQIALEVAQLAEQAERYCRPLAAQYLLVEARQALLRDAALRSAPSGR